MRLLAFADLQATVGTERRFSNPNASLQMYRVKKFYRVLGELFESLKADGIICLGDQTDDRSAIPIPAINAVLEGLERFRGASLLNLKIVGNHEQYQKSTRITCAKLFEGIFKVFDHVDTLKVGKCGFVLAPFPPPDRDAYHTEVQNAIKTLRGQVEKVVLLGHFPIAGSQICGGELPRGISASILDGADVALLGDIHRPQKIRKGAWYVGSPFQQDFGESGESKRIALLDTEQYSVEWIKMEGFPLYQHVDIKAFTELVKEDSEDRFRVTLRSSEEVEKFYAHPLSHRAEPEYAFEEDRETEVESPKVPTDWSFTSAVDRYANRVSPKDKGIDLDPEEMTQFGAELAGRPR